MCGCKKPKAAPLLPRPTGAVLARGASPLEAFYRLLQQAELPEEVVREQTRALTGRDVAGRAEALAALEQALKGGP